MISDKLHPQTIGCVQTRALPFGIEISVENVFETDFSGKDISGVLFQYPDTEGSIMDFSNLTQEAKKFGVSSSDGALGLQFDKKAMSASILSPLTHRVVWRWLGLFYLWG